MERCLVPKQGVEIKPNDDAVRGMAKPGKTGKRTALAVVSRPRDTPSANR
jgi:hypothetical protein